jgi:hypothetical protein
VNRTRKLPACTIMPRTTTLPRSYIKLKAIFYFSEMTFREVNIMGFSVTDSVLDDNTFTKTYDYNYLYL